jgi:hypothetical protein
MKNNTLIATICVALASTASAQFSDGFETYANGSAIEGQGSWGNWDGVNTLYNTVSNAQASTGSQSLSIVGSGDPACNFCSDTVSPLGGPYTSGQWVFTCKQWIPSTFGGTTYWIMLNQFAAGGPYSWSVQVNMNGSTLLVSPDINGAALSQGPNQYPIVFDAWVELRAEIDLDADNCKIYYDNQLLGEYIWSIGVSTAGIAQLSSLDLFPADSTVSAVLYDDFSVIAGTGGGPGLYCSPANSNSSGGPATLGTSSFSGPGVFHLEATGGPASEFGYFLVSATALDPGIPVSTGRLCLGAPIGRYTVNATGSGMNSIGQFDGSGVFQNLAGTSSVGSGFDVPAALPDPPAGVISAGSTWNFQLWYRDGGAGPGSSNFSDGISVTF